MSDLSDISIKIGISIQIGSTFNYEVVFHPFAVSESSSSPATSHKDQLFDISWFMENIQKRSLSKLKLNNLKAFVDEYV